MTILLTVAHASAQSTGCPLVINCPSNIVVSNCFSVQEFYSPIASNSCCGTNVSVTCNPPSGSLFQVGTTTTVNCTAVDCLGQSNACSFTVTVVMGTNCTTNCLQIQCPSNIVVSSCTNLPVFYAPSVTDPCCGSNWTLVCTPASGSYFAPNSTNLVDCYVTDYCGLSNSCSFTVTVLGGTNCPTNCITLDCPSNIVLTTCSNCAPAYYAATASNACCFQHVAFNYSLSSGTCFPIGTNIVQVTAYDPDCASTPPVTCNFTVTVLQSNCCTNVCGGPGSGPLTIQWLNLPTRQRLAQNPYGSNTSLTWIITNLPCYGNVLVVQQAPTNVIAFCSNGDFGAYHAISSFDLAPNTNGIFNFTDASPAPYGPYSWGIIPGQVELGYEFPYLSTTNPNAPLPPYNVTFYFLDGQPNITNLYFATIGMAQHTTNTLSQPFTFRTEFDLYYNSNSYPSGQSAQTLFNGIYGLPLTNGVSGTVTGSAYDFTAGDDFNTGWTIYQPVATLQLTNLPPGSGYDINGNTWPSNGMYPYINSTVNHQYGDIFSLTVGYVCCPCCLEVECPTNKTIPCGQSWSFDQPIVSSCCTNLFNIEGGTPTNVLVTPLPLITNGSCPIEDVTETWFIQDACGNSNYCSQTVTILGCCTNTNSCGCTNANGPPATQSYSILYNFTNGLDGISPSGKLVLSGDTLYGTTSSGGSANWGTVYSIRTNGTHFTVLHEFTGAPGDGAVPYCAGLVVSGNTLYGTTDSGGISNLGTVYSIQTNGAGFEIVHSFVGNDGEMPLSPLVLSGTTLYGTTYSGGASTNVSGGTVFACDASGTPFNTLHSFNGPPGDGEILTDGLVSFGNTLYGATYYGGNTGYGTVFAINAAGTPYNVIYNFTGGPGDGIGPGRDCLVLSGGTLYGTTIGGGSSFVASNYGSDGGGTLFSVHTDGSGETVLHNFDGGPGEGVWPHGGLILAGNTLFGTTQFGYAYFSGPATTTYGGGTVYAIQTDGTGYVVLHDFTGNPGDGSGPLSGLLLSGNTLYGTTYNGGISNSSGTVFALTLTNFSTNCLQIECPTNIDVASCTNVQEFYSPTVIDGACSNWTVVCTPPSGSYFAPGTVTTVTCEVTDCCGNSNSCSFTLTVNQSTGLSVICQGSKTVSCSSNWSFDVPIATSCCTNSFGTGGGGTNVMIIPIGTVTNGACPLQTNIQTWEIIDACGDTNFCSQAVTVTGCCSNPCIEVECPSNIIVTTCSNCVPVYYTANATVNGVCCTNVSEIVYDPPPGTCFNVGVSNVEVSVYACGFVTNCSFTVTVLEETNLCCGPYAGPQTIQWLPFPTNGTNLQDPSGTNPQGSWIVTNLPCYGNVLVTQNFPDLVYWFVNPYLENASNTWGEFNFTETGYGPYSWGACPFMDFYASNNDNYTLNFYFLNGQPNPCGLALGVAGLAANTTATLSQPFTFRTEYDLNYGTNYPNGPSAYTEFGGTYEVPLESGVTSVNIGSAYNATGHGDGVNTGLTVFQPASALNTTNLASGSVQGYSGPLTNLPYFSLHIIQQPGDGIGFNVGYICCSPCSCLQVQCPSNKTVYCTNDWTYDLPTAASCCSNIFDTPTGPTNLMIIPVSTVTNGACPLQTNIQTWEIVDACGNSNFCSQAVTIIGCCTNTNTGPCISLECPGNIVVTTCSNCATVNFAATATVNGFCCTNVASIQYNPQPGSCFPIGTNTVQVTAYACGFVTNCQFDVIVEPASGIQVVCPTNKSVPCESNWSFDTPIASTCCEEILKGPNGPTNLLVTVASTVTNGNCPLLMITQTWSISDGCGDKASCQQVVSVQGDCCSNCLQVNCVTNIVVECGSNWTFDVPTATTCCADGVVHIFSLGAVTNGVCPKYITNTWLISDDCGDSNTCSQSVTVVDTMPPTIVCPTNIQVVYLNSNCDLVIPPISVTASDNCTPYCSLTYSQSPTNGTVITNATSAYVTVTVYDLCGNSNSCTVLVQGRPGPGLTVKWPTNLTTSNCVVPCASNDIIAYDCSCPLQDLRISQTPPCGSPVGPGINSVRVTVTDCNGVSSTKVIPLQVVGEESFLSSLTNTGIGLSGTVLSAGSIDPHYKLGPVPAGTPTGPNGYTAPDALVVTNLWAWLELPPHASAWISPTLTNYNLPPGDYTYTNRFTLPAGANAATASISGRWAADDGAVNIYLNGSATGNSIAVNGTTGFSGWHPFTIASGFQANNTLLFVVTNAGLYSGLRVEFTNATLCSTCVPPVINWTIGTQTVQESGNAVFTANASGPPPMSYQWQINGTNIESATNAILEVPGVSLADAGLYNVIAIGPCGTVINTIPLNVTPALPWPNAIWNVASLANPLAATVGPDLVSRGTDSDTTFAFSAGATEDFGLPNPAGQIVNVMDINPQAGALIQIPPVTAEDTTADASYTVIMDIYEPDTSLGTPALLYASDYITNLSSGGQDGVGLTLDASNYMHITLYSGGMPSDYMSATPMPVDVWNRVALVVQAPQPDGTDGSISGFLNGVTNVVAFNCTCCVLQITNILDWTQQTPSVMSGVANGYAAGAEFFVSSMQFHAIAMTPEMIAAMGSPDTGPLPVNQTTVTSSPVLTATLSDGVINLSWSGSPYVLQETTDLKSPNWASSALPFTETQGSTGEIMTTATIQPETSGPSKFYRLVFRP